MLLQNLFTQNEVPKPPLIKALRKWSVFMQMVLKKTKQISTDAYVYIVVYVITFKI